MRVQAGRSGSAISAGASWRPAAAMAVDHSKGAAITAPTRARLRQACRAVSRSGGVGWSARGSNHGSPARRSKNRQATAMIITITAAKKNQP